VDEDSDENQLVFYVVGSRGGFPALKDSPQVPLHNFTQAQINHSLIVFSHKGRYLNVKEKVVGPLHLISLHSSLRWMSSLGLDSWREETLMLLYTTLNLRSRHEARIV
jgi:hypothetical protein